MGRQHLDADANWPVTSIRVYAFPPCMPQFEPLQRGRSRRHPRQGTPHLLILGGTGDARDLAAALSERFGPALAVTTSLAGRTRTPARVAGAMRSGGFGGAEGPRAAYP